MIGWEGLGLRVVEQRCETERFGVSNWVMSFWREGTDGSVWRERLLWRLLMEALLGISEELLVSETTRRL